MMRMQTEVSSPNEATRKETARRPLDADAIRGHLAPANHDWRVHVVETTASTNSDLLASVRGDRIAQPTILAAETQTDGRGRRGRGWTSFAGASLTVSFALRIARPLSSLDGVTLVCGLTTRDVVAGHGVVARLKWPNDVLVDSRKLAGILVEPHRQDHTTVLVIGIGLNVATTQPTFHDDGRALPPIDLLSAGSLCVDRNRLIAELAIALRVRLDAFALTGFAPFAEAWNAADAFRDRPVALHADLGKSIEGVDRGVDSSGALILDVDGVRRRIVSGDLSLRPKAEG